MPVNVIDSSSAGAWVPEVWAQEILSNLRNLVVLTNLVNKDYSSQVAQEGSQVNVPVPVSFTAQDIPYGPGTQTVTMATRPVPLNRWKGVPIQVSDVSLAQSRPDMLSQYTRAAAIALAEAIETDLFALYTSASATVGTAGTDISPGTVAKARQTLVQNRVPSLESMYMVVHPKDYAALLTSQNVSYALNLGSPEAVQRGRLSVLYGVEIYESQLVPQVAGTPTTTYNLAFSRDAIALVTRPLPAPDAAVRSAVVTDPESGLAFRLTLTYQATPTPSHILNVDLLYGVAVLRPEFLVQVLS